MNTYQYGYTIPPKLLTVAELEQRATWSGLHPEFKRRLIALFDASGGTVGIGGGWRSAAQQEALFRSRYTAFEVPPGVLWNGQYWRLRPGMAPSTPPGRSYHESTVDGKAIGADLIGDLRFVHAHGSWFGLRDLADINAEPWHVQPIEVATARRNYDGQPLKVWTFPWAPDAPPTPTPPSEDDDMQAVFYVKDDPARTDALVFVSGAGVTMFGVQKADGAALATTANAARIAVTAATYDDFKTKALINMGYDPTTGKPR